MLCLLELLVGINKEIFLKAIEDYNMALELD